MSEPNKDIHKRIWEWEIRSGAVKYLSVGSGSYFFYWEILLILAPTLAQWNADFFHVLIIEKFTLNYHSNENWPTFLQCLT